MAPKEDFDVLRLIEHGQTCYVSSDNVSGMQLVRWLKAHPDPGKEKLFRWIQDIVRQLSLIHKCRGQPCYQYVNPYSLVVTEEEEVYFLDTSAGSNEELIREMQRRPIREHFLPPEEPYYQRASEELDIYGLGKTIQFLLAQTKPDPPLSGLEEKKFRKILSKCLQIHSKTAFTQVSDILKYLPKYKPQKIKKTRKQTEENESRGLSRILLPAGFAAALTGLVLALMLFLVNREMGGDAKTAIEMTQAADELFESAKEEPPTASGREVMKEAGASEESQTDEEEKSAPAAMTQEARLNLKLGALYFLELEDYERSRAYFLDAGDLPLAQDMASVCTYMIEGGEEAEQTQIRQALKSAEASLSSLDDTDAADFYPCLLKAYLYMNTGEDTDEILRLGEQCLLTIRTGQQGWVREAMAGAYEAKGDWQAAADACCEWLLVETDTAMRELIFERMAGFLEDAGNALQAREELQKGVREFPQSVTLRIRYLTLLCQDPSVDRTQCADEMTDCLRELPDMQEEEAFKKLLKENGMKLEGDKVWAER